jgi:hypothetical protein
MPVAHCWADERGWSALSGSPQTRSSVKNGKRNESARRRCRESHGPEVDPVSESPVKQPSRTGEKEIDVNTYRLHVRSEEFQYESEIHASNVEEEDGWTIFRNQE